MVSGELVRTGTRVTGGWNAGSSVLFERTTGFLGRVEQTLPRRWTLQADWVSGRHAGLT